MSVWFLLAALMFFGVASVIEAFLSKNAARSMLVIILETAAALGFFWKDDPQILGIIALIMIVMLSWGHFSARARLRNGIEIPFLGASGETLGKFTTGLLLFMILAYVPNIGGNALVVSQQSFRTFFDWTSGFINSFYPDSRSMVRSVISRKAFPRWNWRIIQLSKPEHRPEEHRAPAGDHAIYAELFAGHAGGAIATSSPASDAFYNVLDGVLGAWQNQSSGWFDVGWVTVLFIGLRTLGILFVWLGQFISLVFYELLLALGFMKVTEETYPREVSVTNF